MDACASSNTGILNASLNHPENTTGWTCVAFKTLGYSKKPYTNPNKRTCTVPGEPQLRDKNPPSPLPRTNRTSLVPPPVLSGHAASLRPTTKGCAGGGHTRLERPQALRDDERALPRVKQPRC